MASPFGGNMECNDDLSMDGRMVLLIIPITESDGDIEITSMRFRYQSNAEHKMRAGIYDNDGNLVAQTIEYTTETNNDTLSYADVEMDDTYTIAGTGTYHLVMMCEDISKHNYSQIERTGSYSIDYIDNIYDSGGFPSTKPEFGSAWDSSADMAIEVYYELSEEEASVELSLSGTGRLNFSGGNKELQFIEV